MKIHLRQIPDGGLHLEGEEDCPLPQLNPDEVHCEGPLPYDLDAGVAADALWAHVNVRQPVELRCVRCLGRFAYDLAVEDFTVNTPLAGPEEIDLTPFMRERILLNLPAYAHCDREGGRVFPAPPVEDGGSATRASTRPTDWSALDGL